MINVVFSLALSGAARGALPVPPPPVSIRWEKSFDEAQKKARRTGKPLFVDFWADWCRWCERLDRTTYLDPDVVRASQDFVAVKVNMEGTRRERDLVLQYEIISLPTMLFLSPEGRQIGRVNGFQSPYQFPRSLQAALETGRNVIAWEQALARNPDDPRALASLGAHLYEQGMRLSLPACLDEASELLRRSVGRDTGEPIDDRRRNRMLLAILYNLERNYADAEKLVKDALSLGPDREDDPKLLFVLGQTYRWAGRRDESLETFQIIMRQYPQSPPAQKVRELLPHLE